MERWEGKVALVTGGSVGIGKAIVKKLVYYGMKVVACARNIEQLNEISLKLNSNRPGEVLPYKCDVSCEVEILKMFDFIKQKFGVLHACINNAGIAKDTRILTGKTQDWEQILDVNVIAGCICMREAVKLMKHGGIDNGHVVNIGSVVSYKVGDKPLYAASKFAIRALTEGLRIELSAEKSHIRSTLIAPGLVSTEFAKRAYGKERGEKIYEMNQCLHAEDVANAVVYVLSAPTHVNVNEIIITPSEQNSVSFSK